MIVAYNLFISRLVIVGNEHMVAGRCEFTIAYQHPRPNQMHHVEGRFRRLPNVTKICARGAKPLGDFGLVYQLLPPVGSGSVRWHGNLYQAPPPGYEDRYYTLLECCDVMHSD